MSFGESSRNLELWCDFPEASQSACLARHVLYCNDTLQQYYSCFHGSLHCPDSNIYSACFLAVMHNVLGGYLTLIKVEDPALASGYSSAPVFPASQPPTSSQ